MEPQRPAHPSQPQRPHPAALRRPLRASGVLPVPRVQLTPWLQQEQRRREALARLEWVQGRHEAHAGARGSGVPLEAPVCQTAGPV